MLKQGLKRCSRSVRQVRGRWWRNLENERKGVCGEDGRVQIAGSDHWLHGGGDDHIAVPGGLQAKAGCYRVLGGSVPAS
ncbi:hypothetical protein D3C86_2148020 [compost metagenome]